MPEAEIKFSGTTFQYKIAQMACFNLSVSHIYSISLSQTHTCAMLLRGWILSLLIERCLPKMPRARAHTHTHSFHTPSIHIDTSAWGEHRLMTQLNTTHPTPCTDLCPGENEYVALN